MDANIIEKLSEYINTEIIKQSQRNLAPDEALISSGLIDSFHLVDLAMFVEDAFNVRIDDTELNADTFDTLEQLVELINQRQ